MTGYVPLRDSYITQVNTEVVGKEDENSVDTGDVGNVGIVLANLLTDFIANINNFVFYTGTGVPADALGNENDVYVRTNGGVSLAIWRKDTTTWNLQATIPLGVSYPDGILVGLRTQIDTDALAVTIASGAWSISNATYQKATQTVLNYDPQPLGVNRIDTIYADTSNAINIIAGATSATPVKPTLPANTIEVDSIYVPADGTGLPYLFSGGDSGSSGLTKTVINKLGSDVVSDEIDLSAETLPTDAMVYFYINGVTANGAPLFDEASKLVTNFPTVSSGDAIKIIFI